MKTIIKTYKSLILKLNNLEDKRKQLLLNNTILHHNISTTKKSLNKTRKEVYLKPKLSNKLDSYIGSMDNDINMYKSYLYKNIEEISMNKTNIKTIKDKLSELGLKSVNH